MNNPQRDALRNFLLGGVLPIAAFVIVEQIYGTIGGVIAGLVFGAGEILWEYFRHQKVQGITWISNALILVLGVASLWEGNALFFKLQPAVFMALFAGILLGSSWMGKPFLLLAAQKQNPDIPPVLRERFRGINTRLGCYFILLTALSVHSALYWSTAAWALLKTVGLPLLTLLYGFAEVMAIRLSSR